MQRVFFDIDGVLIQGFHAKPGKQNFWDADIEQDLGIRKTDIQEIFKSWFLDVLQGRLDFEEEMQRWLKRKDYDLKAWQVINYWHERDMALDRPAFDVVKRLASQDDISVYTATNQTHARIVYLRDVQGWGKYFDDFYYSARLGCLKYDSVFFEKIEQELGFDARVESPLYFDDDPKNIEVASARGWNAVLVNDAEDVTNHPLVRQRLTA